MKILLYIILFISIIVAGCSQAQTEAAIPALDSGTDPESWALVPAGDFLKGPHQKLTALDHDYQMMVTLVTNAQYARYLNAALAAGKVKVVEQKVVGYYPGDVFRAHEHEVEIKAGDWLHVPLDDVGLRLVFDGREFSVKPGYENHPMVLVTWFGAQAYCSFYGWRLPTEDEWEKAARGTDNRPFPWGDTLTPQNANYYSSHDIFEKIFGKLGDTTPVGFYNGQTYAGFMTLDSPSPYGLYDMAGNVWQWTADITPGMHYRHLRGGSKADYGYNLRIWTRNSAGPDYASPNVGFRCAQDLNAK